MATTRGRLVYANGPVFDQCDFFQLDGYTPIVGLSPSDLASQVFFQNALQPWPLVSGLNITDAQVSSGRIYMTEIAGSPGAYNIRFRPNAVGYWRVILTYDVAMQITGQDYLVMSPSVESVVAASAVIQPKQTPPAVRTGVVPQIPKFAIKKKPGV